MRRDGVTTIAFVMILLVAISIAGTSIFLARSAGRSTQWFLQAQRSQDLASTALKVVLSRLEELGADSREAGAGELQRLVEDLRSARPSAPRYVLLGPRELHPWSAELTAQLSLWGDGSPDVSVIARVFDDQPLWKGTLRGLPSDPRERKGTLQLTSSARTAGRDGRTVGRTLVLERSFKTVSVRPPLLGRFALFVAEAPDTDPSFCRVAFDEGSGDGRPAAGAPFPLVVSSSNPVEITNGKRLRGAPVLNDALDRNGWIYLGDDSGAPDASPKEWNLRLAHGYGVAGDTPLLPGKPTQTADGWELSHGFAQGEGKIGAGIPGIQAPASAAGGERCSALRLFGTPRALSPTLVFGPVTREFHRRVVTPPGASSAAASSVTSDRYIAALELLMLPRSEGTYGADGVLAEDPVATPPAAREIPCRVESVRAWLAGVGAALSGAAAVAPAFPEDVYAGTLSFPGLYDGNLQFGLQSFEDAMQVKAVYAMKCADAKKYLEKERVVLPGILAVTGPVMTGNRQALVLKRLTFARGGILVVPGDIVLEGDVERAGGAGPVTLVSLNGDIQIGPGASRIQSHLVATRGTVTWPRACTIQGGVAVKRLDLKHIKEAAAQRAIEYDGGADPIARGADADYRVLFGGDDKLAVLGAED